MSRKTITIVVDEDGNSTVDLEGFAGKGCDQALKDFQGEDRVRTERRKAEYYREERTQRERRQC